jgi:hypothetical protein
MKTHSRDDAMSILFCQFLGMIITVVFLVWGVTGIFTSLDELNDSWEAKLDSKIQSWSLED